jgi:hypothetical protein
MPPDHADTCFARTRARFAELSLIAFFRLACGQGLDKVVIMSDLGPRSRRGVRHPMTVVVTAAVCAVVAGYRSYTAIAEWVADVPDATVPAMGIAPDRRPSEA